MSAPARLDSKTLSAALATLPQWQSEADNAALRRTYVFKGFRAAFAFMTRVAALADGMRHHPEWTNVYNRVEVRLTTHDAGGVTQLDVDLARAMDAAENGEKE